METGTPAHGCRGSFPLLHPAPFDTARVFMVTSKLQESALLTRKETAAHLKIALRSLDVFVKSGELSVVRLGKTVRIRPGALDEFITARDLRTRPGERKTA